MKACVRIALLAWPAAVLCAGPQPEKTANFSFFKEIVIPSGAAAKIAAVELDEDVLAAAGEDYADVRVFDEGGTEVPSLIRRRTLARTVARETPVAMATLAFERLADNRIEVIVGPNSDGRRIRAVIFHTGQKDFEKQVIVHGSPDRRDWTQLADAQPIYDYSRFIDLRNVRVEFPDSSFAFYKIEISKITESRQSPLVQIVRQIRGDADASRIESASFLSEDFRIERMEFLELREFVEGNEPVIRAYGTRNLAVTNDIGARTTIVAFESRRAPLTQLTVLTPSVNFSRMVDVEALDDGTEAGKPAWRKVASSSLTRIDMGNVKKDSTAISLGGPRRFSHYRLTIHNLDNPPLAVASVAATGEVHEAIFLFEPGRRYRLFYGGENQRPPRYDIGAVLQNAGEADTFECSCGREELNPARKLSRAARFSGKGMLVAAVILMVAALVWLIAATLKRVEAD